MATSRDSRRPSSGQYYLQASTGTPVGARLTATTITTTDLPSVRQGLAIAVLSALLYLIVGPVGVPGLPYVWHTAAVASLVFASLFAWQCSGLLERSWTRSRRAGLAVAGAVVSVVLCITMRGQPGTLAIWPVGDVLRNLVAVSGMTAIAVAARLAFPQATGSTTQTSPASMLWLGALLAVLPAWTQFHATVEKSQQSLTELIGQHQLGEALQVAGELSLAAPDLRISSRPVSSVRDDLAAQLNGLVQQAQQIAGEASPESRIQLGRTFAILGEPELALESLQQGLAFQPDSAQAWQILGTVYEHQQDWPAARRAYTRAVELWTQQDDQVSGIAGEVAAWKGIGFAARKAGDLRAAEAAYQQVLHRDPSAAHHFLLAQFYESAERDSSAIAHARIAAELAPGTFAAPAADIVNQVAKGGFGCWLAFGSHPRAAGSSTGQTFNPHGLREGRAR